MVDLPKYIAAPPLSGSEAVSVTFDTYPWCVAACWYSSVSVWSVVPTVYGTLTRWKKGSTVATVAVFIDAFSRVNICAGAHGFFMFVLPTLPARPHVSSREPMAPAATAAAFSADALSAAFPSAALAYSLPSRPPPSLLHRPRGASRRSR